LLSPFKAHEMAGAIESELRRKDKHMGLVYQEAAIKIFGILKNINSKTEPQALNKLIDELINSHS